MGALVLASFSFGPLLVFDPLVVTDCVSRDAPRLRILSAVVSDLVGLACLPHVRSFNINALLCAGCGREVIGAQCLPRAIGCHLAPADCSWSPP